MIFGDLGRHHGCCADRAGAGHGQSRPDLGTKLVEYGPGSGVEATAERAEVLERASEGTFTTDSSKTLAHVAKGGGPKKCEEIAVLPSLRGGAAVEWPPLKSASVTFSQWAVSPLRQRLQ
jgi:hypothetical protein